MDTDCLTSQDMERSFNHGFQTNFYMLCPNLLDMSSTGFIAKNQRTILMNASRILDTSELRDKTKTISIESQHAELTQRIDEEDLHESSKMQDNTTIVEDSNELTTVEEYDSESSNDATTNNTTTNTNLNETIIQSIRNPFSYEIKNRLMKRCGGVDYLKTKTSYTNLVVNAPIIKEKSSVFLGGNMNYNIIKEVGKGSYAIIYAMTNKNETCALKVIPKYY